MATTHDNELTATGLLGRLIQDVTALLRNEFALARAEMMESVQRAKGGIGAIAIGGGVLLAGGLTLVAALVLGLGAFMDLWLAALIVGAVLAAVGYGMVNAGKRRLDPSNLSLPRTQQSLRKDRQTVTQSVGSNS
jgi:hypothetical protein